MFYIINEDDDCFKQDPYKHYFVSPKLKDTPANLHIGVSITVNQSINQWLSCFNTKRPPPPSKNPCGSN